MSNQTMLRRQSARTQNPASISRVALGLQAELKVGTVNDPLEHEADRVADAVMRIPDAGAAATRQVSRACTSCEEEATNVSRKTKDGFEPIDAAPASVHDVLRSSGQPLDPAARDFMEERFDYDFSPVRIHTDSGAANSAHEVDAHAYTVGEHVVFGRNRYAPSSTDGRKLLAHELTHVAQQSRADHGHRAPRNLVDSLSMRPPVTSPHAVQTSSPSLLAHTVRRAPVAASNAPGLSLDQIVQEIGPGLGGPYTDYPAYAATMVAGTFLGHSVERGCRPEFLTKLKSAESKIDAEYVSSDGSKPTGYAIGGVGGFRSKEGPHGWGLAIDIDSRQNPFVMHEAGSTPAKDAGERKVDKQVSPVFDRVAYFILNDPITLPAPIGGPHQSIIPVLITKTGTTLSGGRLPRDERWAEYYDRLKRESDALKKYFALMKGTQDDRDNFIKTDWKSAHPGQPGPDFDNILKQMWEDYATLGGVVPDQGPPGVDDFQKPDPVGPADRPFKGGADPAQGFLTIPREVVVGLGQVLTRWGAVDFGGESGDLMHFDDMQGLGLEVSRARSAAQANITAATGGPTSAATANPAPASALGSVPTAATGTSTANIDAGAAASSPSQ